MVHKPVLIMARLVNGYEYAHENIDFYDNKYEIRQKSIYQRKYNTENILLIIIRT